jgi:hypothetical protein
VPLGASSTVPPEPLFAVPLGASPAVPPEPMFAVPLGASFADPRGSVDGAAVGAVEGATKGMVDGAAVGAVDGATSGGNSIGISGFYWTNFEESRLLNWFNAFGLDEMQSSNFFSEIAAEIGRTNRACRDELKVIFGAGVLTKDAINFMISRYQNYEYNQEVPPDMRLDKLSSADDSIKSFKERQENGASAFHITQVHPNQMSCLNKDLFIQLNPSLQIDENKNILLDDLDGKKCILADNYIRQQGIHDFETIPIPHLKHPTTGDFRIDIHDKTYLCNYLFFALNKYRTARDREKWYNFGKSAWSDSCYLYIVRNEETIRSGFADVAVGFGESKGLECFGKSKYPVQYDGCYKVTWNGRGISNATFNYIAL